MKNYFKNLKILLFLCCFTLVASTSQAQVKFGIKAGANGSNLLGFEKFLNSTEAGRDITTDMLIGYQVGLSLDLSAGKFFIRPDLEFSDQGFAAKYKWESADVETEKFHLYYMKLPVHIGYKHAINMDSDLRFGIGGYAAYYLTGNEAMKGYEIKKLDYGVSAMIAFDYVNTSTSIGYEYGLVDVIGADGWSAYKKANKLSDVRSGSLRISVAYYF